MAHSAPPPFSAGPGDLPGLSQGRSLYCRVYRQGAETSTHQGTLESQGRKWLTIGYNWIQLDTIGYNWIQLLTLGYTWIQLDTIRRFQMRETSSLSSLCMTTNCR